MPSSRPAPAFLRFLIRRLALQAGLGAVLAACAPSPQPTEDFGSTSSALGVAGLFSTGVDATGMPLAIGSVDPHYVLSSDDPARPGPNALVIAPVSGWVGNTVTSNWIGAEANGVATNGDNYTYTMTFTLNGVDPSKVIISGSWACDDSCVINLNGTVVASYAAPASMAVAAFTIAAGSPFVAGTNTLAFVVTSNGAGTAGLQVVSISGTSFRCSADSQCAAAQFCNTQTGNCVPTLPSGTPIPTISGHTPVLDGVCASGVGEAVCQAGVCDTSTNECGLADGGVADGGGADADTGASEGGDAGEDAGASEGGGTGADAGGEADTSLDGAIAPDASEGEDGNGLADGGTDGGAIEDGHAATDAKAIEDASAGDAGEEDAAAPAKEDAGEEGADAGLSPNKVLEGDGLSCSTTGPRPRGPSGLPIGLAGVAIVAAMRRKRRDRARSSERPARPSAGDHCE